MTNNPTIDGVSRLGTFEMIQALLDLDARGSLAPHGIGGLARDVLTKVQSTIARLEARITQLESEKEFAAATYQAARDRIAELESGRGEPVAWEMDDTAGESGLIQVTNDPAVRDEWVRDELPVCPLFAAPPAPVAVVLPERKSDSGREWDSHYVAEVEGWNACLYATAALNGPTK